jgi:quercetin dioxygenase-like cupin family protein
MGYNMSDARADSARYYQWESMPAEPLKGGMTRKMISTERLMIAHVHFDKGDEVPTHCHENEQITYILAGALHFWLGEKGEREVIVRAGEVLVIPSMLPHRARALEDTLDMDVFNPPREDWLNGTDAYLRRG